MTTIVKLEHTPPAAPLTVRALRKVYGARQVLEDVSFDVLPASVTALVGRSGSGKSTLLHIVAGLEQPTSGSVTIEGVELASLDSEEAARVRRDRIGIVFQFFHLLPTLTLAENISLPGRLKGDPDSVIQPRLDVLLDAVGIGGVRSSYPDTASGGELQRAAIARALFNGPAIIIADEPTGNLDHENARQILALFQDLRARFGMTMLIATHDREVLQGVDRVLELDDGKISVHP
jgi:putative ABC transport system ATP-binding protein